METNIQKYQALVEVVRCGSFTRAAKNLSYSQSGISRMVADLEHDWGMTVVERGRGGAHLTGDGLQVLPLVESICDDYRRLQVMVSGLHDLSSGSITVGTFSSVATHILPEVIGRFQKDYPGIDYELLMGGYAEIEDWVAQGRVDFGFLPYEPHAPGIVHRELIVDDFLAVLPEGHPLAGLEEVPLEAFLDEPFILLERAGADEISPIFERAELHPKVQCTTWDDYAIMSMVENGLGLSILPALVLRRNPYRIALRPLATHEQRHIGVIYRDDVLSLASQRFMDYLSA